MDLSKIKADIPSSTSHPNTTEPQTECPEEVVEEKDKMAQKNPLASQLNEKKGEPTKPTEIKNEKQNEQDQSKGDPSKDPSCLNPASEKVKADFLETRTFLTEVDPQIFSRGKHKKKESKADIRNESKFIAQKKKTPNYYTTYKNLIESLPNFAGDSTQISESSQSRINADKLSEKSLSEKDNFVGCFNELLLRYADLFTQTDRFSSEEQQINPDGSI